MSKKNKRRVRPFYSPPSLLARQMGSVLLMAALNGWKKLPQWIFTEGFKALPVSNGAIGMGCIGYPGHPVWEVTSSCNLNCIHCHAKPESRADELTTDEGKRLIDQIAAMDEFRTLVFSGGEPLVRPDIFELFEHSQKAGLANILATNGTLIDEEMAFKLKDHGVVCNAISIDAPCAEIHNRVRNRDGAFELALRALAATRKAGIQLQINTTAMEYNLPHLSELIDFVNREKAGIMLMYQLVAVGKGEKIEGATLAKNENQDLIHLISEKQANSKTIIEPVAGPQYWPYLLEKRGVAGKTGLKIAEKIFHGCAAGRRFVYIKYNGEVWPCPFVEVSGGNIREQSLAVIYRQSEPFVNLRRREEILKGNCGTCDYRKICGGCRGRAHAYTGDYLQEDPRCFLK